MQLIKQQGPCQVGLPALAQGQGGRVRAKGLDTHDGADLIM